MRKSPPRPADNPYIEPQRPISPANHRLWLAGSAMVTLILTLVVGNFCIPADKRLTPGMVGHDFLAFYTAGTFVRDGHARDLYDLDKVNAFQHDLAARDGLEIGESFGPFWNPPFYAWVFVPLAALPYHAALLTWEAVNIACLIASIVLLIRLLRPSIWRRWALIPIFLCTSMPLVQAMTHGQNTMVSLLLLTSVVTFWRAGRAIPAGVTAGLLLYKPQLGLLVAIAICLTLGWRAVVGLAVMGSLLLLTNILTLPHTIADYLARMPGNLRLFQVEHAYLWDRHVTLRAFWRLLLQGRSAGEMATLTIACWLASCSALAAGLLWAWNQRRRDGLTDRSPLIAAVIASMPLLMPFYFDYDLLLVSVPLVLYAAGRTDRWLTRAWVALFLWLMVNSTIARLTDVNGTALLLSAIAAMLIRRAGTRAADTEHAPGFPGAALAGIA